MKLYHWINISICSLRLDLRVKEKTKKKKKNKKISSRIKQTYSQHYAMFDVEQNLFLFSVVPDESMQCVRMINPTNQTWICWQWDNCVSLNSENSNHNNQYITALILFQHKTKGRSWMRCSSTTLALTQTQKCKHDMRQSREPYPGFIVFSVDHQLTLSSVTD